MSEVPLAQSELRLMSFGPAPLGEQLVTTPKRVGSAVHQRRLRPVLDTHHPLEHGQPSMRGGGEALLT
jgi:hypothetical protein